MEDLNIQRCLTLLNQGSGIPLHQRKPSKKVKNDNWWTPWWLFNCLCAIYKLKPLLDVCADNKNKKCDHYFTKKDNALNRDWVITRTDGRLMIADVWCNPPNSKLGDFINKAYEQYNKYKHLGIKIMMVIPTNSMSSNAFWDSIELPKDRGEKIFYKPIYKRVEFLDKGKKPDSSARNAYLVVIWG